MRISGTILKEKTGFISKDWQINSHLHVLNYSNIFVYVPFLYITALIDFFNWLATASKISDNNFFTEIWESFGQGC